MPESSADRGLSEGAAGPPFPDRRSGPTVGLLFPGCHRRGGVERSIRELSRRLAATYPVQFIGDDFDADGMAGVEFVPVGGRPGRGFLAPWSFRGRAASRLSAGRPDVTISYGADCPPGDILYVNSVHRAWLGHGRPIPTRLGTVPNSVRYALPQHRMILAMERRYFRSSPEAVVAVSQQTAGEIVDLYDVPRARITTIPNGYSADEFSPQRRTADRPAMRARLGLDDDVVVLLLVANELHRKGFGPLLEATARLDDRRVQVHVVGRAPIDAYRSQIERLGLSDRVRWHGPSTEVAPWYAVGDLFVMPTQYEAFPLVVVEALASGLPVVTTAVAGSSEAIQPGVNGLLQRDPDDVDELTDLLEQGLDPDRRDAWSRAAPATVDRLEWGRLADRLASVIDGLGRPGVGGTLV